MQFLVYVTVLMVSISTVLLELHWLTTPPPQPKPAVAAASTGQPPKVEGPSAALSPVYPRKPEANASAANAQQPVPDQSQTQQAQTKPQGETTGMAHAEDRPPTPATPASPASARVDHQQASAVQPEVSKANNRCDIQACASTYRSFRASDCTYQPFDGGERRLCAKETSGITRSASGEAAATRKSARDAEFRERESEHRSRVFPHRQ